ncbi:carboxypeptidase-like regulatory domain-containing protein [Marinifilum flexuosum]|uniref:carboxypeptidase-like regulatory domain-containing protein n=1 Tax=Marinifilum flexuosum TaxID=1117708 RepID=UPI0024958AA7|nr:carboxypeptidase-like regulatory domain-containing protein [Marinifilum flexuosum]
MDNESNLKLDSFVQTNTALTENASIYETNVNTKAQADQFASDLEQLLNLKEEADQPVKWLIGEKNAVKKSLIDKLYLVCNGLVCYANSVSNSEILGKASVTKYVLTSFSELKLIDFYKQIIGIARQHVADLPAFGVSEESIAAVETDSKAFEQKRADLILLKEDKATARDEFNRLLKKINKLLNYKLDYSIENLRATHPDFVNYYFAARQKAKGVQRHYDVLGYLKDKASGEPISLGKVSVEGMDLATHITANGTFRFRHFPEGEHRLVIENINYKTLYVSIRRYASERSKLHLEMEAIPLEVI